MTETGAGVRGLLTDLARTLVPPHGDRHGPLPPLLLALTLLTGMVDAVSYLALGHVFVANMTGNVVFLGFALAGAATLSAPAAAVSMAAFLAGALAGGRLGTRFARHRGHLLTLGTGIQSVLLTAAVVTAASAHGPLPDTARYTLIALLGAAMGLQNAVARGLGVPDISTTVLTTTLTGLAADSGPGATGPHRGRRVLSVLAMVLGAFGGAALLLRTSVAVTLGAALAVLVVTGILALRLSSAAPAWTRPPT
ncbi:YoaK family protein [Streptomyces sp. NPDC053755]|uniref:YoaK family protein n=1 Tax=Streptomyces sp. NPDC053755 TaxID=3155815 RepID=UPI0034144E92